MTELIVALDGPDCVNLAKQLYNEADIRWFKIGPQTMLCGEFDRLMSRWRKWAFQDSNFFLDLKLADTADTCREAARRFAEAGIAAVSTFTDRATEAAMCGAEGSAMRVWRVLRLTDGNDLLIRPTFMGDGFICSVSDLINNVTFSSDIDKICPGIRLEGSRDGHLHTATPQSAKIAGATHIVVGRPIWAALDPVAAARRYLEALR